MKLTLFRLFHFTVACYALFLIWLPFRSMAQVHPLPSTVQQLELQELDRRITSIEALNLDRRLAVIEARLMENAQLNYFGAGGIGLLVLKGVSDAVRSRKTRGESK